MNIKYMEENRKQLFQERCYSWITGFYETWKDLLDHVHTQTLALTFFVIEDYQDDYRYRQLGFRHGPYLGKLLFHFQRCNNNNNNNKGRVGARANEYWLTTSSLRDLG
ncbi:hypothetical protein V1478_014661 [Vespula squamosa]|uniref:Uncharacterized protein n=1 Tax=Vespula squamosa TaxID=30214 RepID=A0ABD2A2V4_VESSQ